MQLDCIRRRVHPVTTSTVIANDLAEDDPLRECPHRTAVIGLRPRNGGSTTPLFRCMHHLNVPAQAVALECSACGGSIPACEKCPFWDRKAKQFICRQSKTDETDEKDQAGKTGQSDQAGRAFTFAAAASFKQKSFDEIRPRYVRQSEMIEAALRLLDGDKLPTDISMVAGVPRSGMMAAAAIATQLDVPLATLSKEGQLLHLGNGERGIRRMARGNSGGKLLVVDDTVYGGHQITKIRNNFKGMPFLIAAVYANPQAKHIPDVYGELLPSPHFLEWNVFNGHMLAGHCIDKTLQGGIGLDLDGLLCSNPPFADEDSEAFAMRFAEWCEWAIPTRCRPQLNTIPLVITARLERYRDVTVSWLAKWGMRVKDLVMHPAKVPGQRGSRDAIARWKADHLRKRGVRWFFESNTHPAIALSFAWPEGYVLDVESGKFFRRGYQV